MKIWRSKNKMTELFTKDPDASLDLYFSDRNQKRLKQNEVVKLAYAKFLKFNKMDILIPKSL